MKGLAIFKAGKGMLETIPEDSTESCGLNACKYCSTEITVQNMGKHRDNYSSWMASVDLTPL